MTDNQPDNSSEPQPKPTPEPLALRSKPLPITRISRKALIGAASLVLILIAGLVLVALRPPTWRTVSPTELFNVDRKPITDGLAKLPATYDGIRADRPDSTKGSPALPPGVRQLETQPADVVSEAERIEKVRLARLAGQARESTVFFRLQLKAPPRETPRADAVADIAGTSSRSTTAADGDLGGLSAMRAAERTKALANGNLDPVVTDATEQTRKLAFLNATTADKIYNPHRLQTPASPYQLMAGTIIAGSLVSGLSSDLPGFVIAQVTEHVYDTVTGRHLLLPQGSRLIGKYDSVVAFGQERALVVWQRIIRPDGSSIVIDNLPATDTAGYAGLADAVDLHTWKLLKGIFLSTVLGIGNQLAFSSTDSDLVKALRESTGQTINRSGQRLIEKSLNVQPTITVRPGWPLRIIVHKDLVLKPYRNPTAN